MKISHENPRNVTINITGAPYPPDILATIAEFVETQENLYAVNPNLLTDVSAVPIQLQGKTPYLRYGFNYTLVKASGTYTFAYTGLV